MKKTIYISSIFFLSLFAFNSSAQSVSYTYVRNDPFDTKNLTFAIDPLFVDINSHNGVAMGWALRAEHMMGKTLLLNFDARFGFGTSKYRKSNENTRNYFSMEGGLGLIFYNKTKNHNVPIILSQTTSGNTRTTTYIRGGVPAKIRRIVALRAGGLQYTNTIDYTKFKADSLITFTGPDSTVSYQRAKAAKFFEYKSDTGKAAPLKTLDQFGGIAMTTIYVGLQFRKIVNLLIDVEGYGYRGNIRYQDFYFDALFAPILALKDYEVPVQGGGVTTYKVNYTQLSRLGWRMGWFWRKPKDQGFSAKFEFGSRPGFKAATNTSVPINIRNMYCMFTFGLYIPLKVKPFYSGE